MHRLVSPFILDRYAAGEASGRLDAATLFVDVSGFSAMTSALMAHGQHGAEVLAQVMRAIFDPLVEAVYAHGGFITVFAGDAFTAVFPAGVGRDGNSPYMMRALAAAWANVLTNLVPADTNVWLVPREGDRRFFRITERP